MSTLISILVSVVLLLFSLFPKDISPQVVFLDVDQGDSMIFSSSEFQMIVDGGPGNYLINKIGRYISVWDKEIEVVVITHPHTDHYFGVEDVFEQYSVKKLVIPDTSCSKDALWKEFLASIPAEVEIVNNLEMNVEGVGISVKPIISACSLTNTNNNSLLTQITYEDISILNMGDIEEEVEDEIYVGEIDFLKAGHHCSKTSSSEEFITKLSPKYVFCSVGEDNRFGHPSQEVLGLFDEVGSTVFLSYLSGDVILNLNEKVIYNWEHNVIGNL